MHQISENSAARAAPLVPQDADLNKVGTSISPIGADLRRAGHGANESMTILPGDTDVVVVIPVDRLGSRELSFRIFLGQEGNGAGSVPQDEKKANEADEVRDAKDSNEAIEQAKEDVKKAIRERYYGKDIRSDPASVQGLSDDGKRQVFEAIVNWTFEGFDDNTNAWVAALAELAADSGLCEYLSNTVPQSTYNELSGTQQFALAKAVVDAAGMVVK